MENTKIEWATHTFNPWMGCTKVSPACKNCYAERDMDSRLGVVQWGDMGTRVMTSDANWRKPLKWNSEAESNGTRPRVFCASLADVFEDWRGRISDSSGDVVSVDANGEFNRNGTRDATMDNVRARLFKLIDATPQLDWLLLTKRPENIRQMWPSVFGEAACINFSNESLPGHPRQYRRNVWIGTSVENQEQADKRIPKLLECRELSPVLFLSCEPLLGQLEFSNVTKRSDAVQQLGKRALSGIDWVIAGGESGPNARPSNPDWFRSLRDQCQAAGVSFLFKQWGEFLAHSQAMQMDEFPVAETEWTYNLGDDDDAARVGKKKAGRVLDGREWTEFPEAVKCSN